MVTGWTKISHLVLHHLARRLLARHQIGLAERRKQAGSRLPHMCRRRPRRLKGRWSRPGSKGLMTLCPIHKLSSSMTTTVLCEHLGNPLCAIAIFSSCCSSHSDISQSRVITHLYLYSKAVYLLLAHVCGLCEGVESPMVCM
ncbi:hypothetical protein BKA62DRAFT_636696, partial [Auriculariales sp. MPI-PUGE-AT-0066]